MQNEPMKNVCVIGAGTMGSGIAAHLANLGFQVTLLDLNLQTAVELFDRAKRARPPHFFVGDFASRVRMGSIAEHLDLVAEADWVCEAIVEKLEAKQELFEKLEPVLKPSAMVSTNTSGIQISLIAQGRSESFRRRFMGTHFFNPPRYLKLLELIPTPDTDPAEVTKMTRFLEDEAARRVVLAKDTPGFIANRFGMWAMLHAIHVTERLYLSVEQVDAITGPFLGRPKSASFRLNDIVGLDVMQDVASNLYQRRPDDPHRNTLRLPPSMAALLERGWIGEKSGQGYYRREGKELVALDLSTRAYRQKREVRFDALDALAKRPLGERIAAALDLRDEPGEFLREYLIPVLRYADYLKEEISYNVEEFDRVMKWGFGWEMGPFETIDAIGPEKVGVKGGPFYRNKQMRAFDGSFAAIKFEPQYRSFTDYEIIDRGESFTARDLGDGVTALLTTTKMGVLTPAAIQELLTWLERFDGRLVLSSEARAFSAGFDLDFLHASLAPEQTEAVIAALTGLQRLSLRLGELRSVAAVFGYCLGGGLEVAMGCSTIAAASETQIGLPEAKVGLIPSGSGAARMRLMHQGDLKALSQAARNLYVGAVSVNAEEARLLGYLRETDVTVYHPDRLATEAKALALVAEPRPLPEWKPVGGPLAGMIDRDQAVLRTRGDVTDYDVAIGDKVKAIFAKTASFEDAMQRERLEFVDLLHHALTQSRIRHMLETGKPLRN